MPGHGLPDRIIPSVKPTFATGPQTQRFSACGSAKTRLGPDRPRGASQGGRDALAAMDPKHHPRIKDGKPQRYGSSPEKSRCADGRSVD